MKRAMFLLCAAMAWCTAQAQRPALRFDAEGRFKIVQFTDVHLDLSTPYRQGEAVKTLGRSCATCSLRSAPTWRSSRATW